jgi:hypothetical protein
MQGAYFSRRHHSRHWVRRFDFARRKGHKIGKFDYARGKESGRKRKNKGSFSIFQCKKEISILNAFP